MTLIIPKSLIIPYLSTPSSTLNSSIHQLLSYYIDLFIIELNNRLKDNIEDINQDKDDIGNVIMQSILDFC